MRGNLEDLIEETLADFLAKNREQHPIEPNFNPGGRLTCVDDREFERICRTGRDERVFAGSSPSRMGRCGFRGSGSTAT